MEMPSLRERHSTVDASQQLLLRDLKVQLNQQASVVCLDEIYTLTYTHKCIYMYVYTHVYIFIYTCIHVCMLRDLKEQLNQ